MHEDNPFNLRHANDLQTIHANTSLYYTSFLPSTFQEWNSIQNNIRQADSLTLLNRHLNSNISPKPLHYNAVIILDQIVHTRLRLECSSLNEHLFNKNPVASPNCICGEIETVTHFWFDCPRFARPRQDHIGDLLAHCTTKDLLFGEKGSKQ